MLRGREYSVDRRVCCRDVNKAGSFKARAKARAKAKAKSLKAKAKSLKAMAKARSLKAKTKAKARSRSRLRSNSIVMACNCSLVQNSINPQQISKQSRTLPSFYYHVKYSWCKLKRNVSQMPILILLSFEILAARRIILTESHILFGWI